LRTAREVMREFRDGLRTVPGEDARIVDSALAAVYF
jgi:hypothetical protein